MTNQTITAIVTDENNVETEVVFVNRLDEIVQEVCASLDNIQSESLKVGKLLNEANAEFKADGKKGADFVDWCFVNFSIKKAQAYKLMKVAEVFADDKAFDGVAMRVLYALATQATEDELAKARELAANKSLTSAMLNVILAPKAETPEPKAAAIEEGSAAGDVSILSVKDAEEAPFDDGAKALDVATKQPVAISEGGLNEEGKALLNENASLRAQITELLTRVKELTEAQVTHNANRQAVELPQFNSACHYAVLGLSAEEATKKTLVKKAFRGLVAAGYGNGHASFEKIVAAKDALLAE